MDEKVSEILSFLKEVEKLKLVERVIYLSDGNRKESVPEHTWHVLVLFHLLDGKFDFDVDKLKVFRMILVHDMVELYAGDTFIFDEEARKTKQIRELESANRLFSILPGDLGGELRGLWEDYDLGVSKEAKLAKALDKIQAVIQMNCAGKQEYPLEIDRLKDYNLRFVEHDPKLLDLLTRLIEDLR